jgi:group I intron endonuclease
MNGIIYKAVNKINGKVYIGKTTYDLEFRLKAHINRAKQPFQFAIRKYGRDGFDVSIVAHAETEAELSAKEMEWIKKCDCRGPKGYNMTDGGEGSLGYVATPEARAKISQSRKGRKFGPRSDEFKKLMSDKLKGRKLRPLTEEAKRKISEAMLRRPPPSEEARAKWSRAFKGRIISDHARECISKANKGRIKSEETRKKISASHKGVPLSAEHARRIGEGNRGRKYSEATILKMSEARKQWWLNRSVCNTVNA